MLVDALTDDQGSGINQHKETTNKDERDKSCGHFLQS